MEKERLQKAGDFILDGVLIVGSSGIRVNIIDQVQELNIYESIDSPYISGNILGKKCRAFVSEYESNF